MKTITYRVEIKIIEETQETVSQGTETGRKHIEEFTIMGIPEDKMQLALDLGNIAYDSAVTALKLHILSEY